MAPRSRAKAASGFSAVERVSPTQQIREQLIAAIESGEFPPGSSLPSERVLCESFQVSRVSVREAIAGLEAMGLITVQHGRGAFVRESINDRYALPFAKYLQIHRAELLELIKVRGALDELAAREAALYADESALEEVERAGRAFEEAADAGDLSTAPELDRAFHLAIANATKGELLPRLLLDLNELLTESRSATLAQAGQLQKSAGDHRAIVKALLDRDPAAARRAVERHMSRLNDLLESLPSED